MKEEFDRLTEEAEEIRNSNQITINDAIDDDDIYTLLLHYDDKVMVCKHSTKQDIDFPKDVTIEEIIIKLKEMK